MLIGPAQFVTARALSDGTGCEAAGHEQMLSQRLASAIMSGLHTTAVQYAMMQRSFWDAELRQVMRARAAAGTCHDDSRLEFLLRTVERFSLTLVHFYTFVCQAMCEVSV
eukprot:s678_g5.t1